MNRNKIDWMAALRMVNTANQEDDIVVGFKALLLHPDIFENRHAVSPFSLSANKPGLKMRRACASNWSRTSAAEPKPVDTDDSHSSEHSDASE